MVLEEPAGMNWSYMCASKSDAGCMAEQIEGKDSVFYRLDLVHGKGERLGAVEGVSDSFLSFDGSRIAVVRAKGHEGQIQVLTLSDHAWHEISLEPAWGQLQNIGWAADGKGFFVTSRLPDSFDLLNVTLTGKVRLLFRNGARESLGNPIPSPDGKHLAYEGRTTDSNIWMLENF